MDPVSGGDVEVLSIDFTFIERALCDISSLHVMSLCGIDAVNGHERSTTRARTERAAAIITKEFEQIELPTVVFGNSEATRRQFTNAINRGCTPKGNLALELYRGYPDHDPVPRFLSIRWAGMNKAQNVLNETIAILKREKRDL